MTIKNIIFDIGDVLVSIDWLRGHDLLQGEMTDSDGQELTGPLLHKKIFSPLQVKNWDNYGDGRIGDVEFIKTLRSNLSHDGVTYQGDDELLLRVVSEVFEPIPERIALLNRLIATGRYQVALLSDTNPLHADYIEKTAAAIFTHIPAERRFYSHDLGYQKKNGPEIFQKMLRALDAVPNETLMIDDRIKNQTGAEATGINFMLLNRNDDLVVRLLEYNVVL